MRMLQQCMLFKQFAFLSSDNSRGLMIAIDWIIIGNLVPIDTLDVAMSIKSIFVSNVFFIDELHFIIIKTNKVRAFTVTLYTNN